jgi:hypothetical protein
MKIVNCQKSTSFPIPIPSKIHRQRQGVKSTLFGPGQNFLHQLAIFPNVQLKHFGPIVQFADFGDARGGQRAQSVEGSVVFCGLGGGGFTLLRS